MKSGTKPETMKDGRPRLLETVVHSYYLNVGKDHEAKAYRDLCERLRNTTGRGKRMKSWGGNTTHYEQAKDINNTTVQLETKHPFSNQWNTACGLRLFDWAEDIYDNEDIKAGHYLDITPEMAELRQRVSVCGYCGKSVYDNVNVFCQSCFYSEYLEEKDLNLLRMFPVALDMPTRKELTEGEKDLLLPLYRDAQIHGSTKRGKARIAKERRRIKIDYESATKHAKDKHDGLLWLMDHGINTGNVIYYGHTGRFCFGWRKPCSKEVASKLRDELCEFLFDYDIKEEGA